MLFCPIGWNVGQVGVTSIVQQASSTSVTTTITAPADIQAGDILVLLDQAEGFSIPTTTIPSGFTSIGNITMSTDRQIVSYKIADGSEASASLTGMSGALGVSKVLVTFRPNAPATSVTVADVGGQFTDGNPTAQVVNASGGTPPLIVIGAYGSFGTINPRTFNPVKDGEVENQGGTLKTVMAWKIYASSPADVTIDMDDEGNRNGLQSAFISVS